MAGRRRRYRFVISESFTPETLPMFRLAEYLTDLATLLGERPAVHFVALEGSSTAVVQDIEHEAYPKVRARVHGVKHRDAPRDAIRAYDALNMKLADDNASGVLIEESSPEEAEQAPARVLEFPGRNKFVELEYGPVTQQGTLQGQVIMVGGQSDPVPVHLQDGETIHLCHAKRAIAKELGKLMFDPMVRAIGHGRWFRDATGQWVMRSFSITGYSVLNDDTLSTVLTRLRSVPGRWKEDVGAADVLKKLRADEA